MSYGDSGDNQVEAEFNLVFQHTSTGAQFTLKKSFGLVYGTNGALGINDLNSLMQDFVDAVDASSGFEYVGGGRTYSTTQELTAT